MHLSRLCCRPTHCRGVQTQWHCSPTWIHGFQHKTSQRPTTSVSLAFFSELNRISAQRHPAPPPPPIHPCATHPRPAGVCQWSREGCSQPRQQCLQHPPAGRAHSAAARKVTGGAELVVLWGSGGGGAWVAWHICAVIGDREDTFNSDPVCMDGPVMLVIVCM